MANFFEGVGNLLKHPIDEAKWMFDSTKDVLKGDMKLKDVPGSHQEMMNDITVPILGDNKIAKNSDAIAGAVVGGVLAAPLLAGGGAGASGGASFGGFGTEGAFSKYFSPIGNKLSGMWDSVAGPSDDVLGMMADQEAGGAVGTGEEALAKAKGALPKGMDLQQMGQMLQSIKPNQQQISHSGGRAGGGFRFDPSQYQNKLGQREFDQLYGAAIYKPLT